jgi:hypothetical protein
VRLPYASGKPLAPILSEALEIVMAVFAGDQIPMTMHDDGRRHVEANRPAQLMARSSLAERRSVTVDDLMPPDELPVIDAIWARMLASGFAAGRGPRVVTARARR